MFALREPAIDDALGRSLAKAKQKPASKIAPFWARRMNDLDQIILDSCKYMPPCLSTRSGPLPMMVEMRENGIGEPQSLPG
jgi:hypothetical protein